MLSVKPFRTLSICLDVSNVVTCLQMQCSSSLFLLVSLVYLAPVGVALVCVGPVDAALVDAAPVYAALVDAALVCAVAPVDVSPFDAAFAAAFSVLLGISSFLFCVRLSRAM